VKENIRRDLKKFRELFYSFDRNSSHQNKPDDFKRVLAAYR